MPHLVMFKTQRKWPIHQNNTFGGEHNLTMLNQMDKKLSLDLASNSLLYKLNSLTEKLVQKHQEQNTHKSSLNLLA